MEWISYIEGETPLNTYLIAKGNGTSWWVGYFTIEDEKVIFKGEEIFYSFDDLKVDLEDIKYRMVHQDGMDRNN